MLGTRDKCKDHTSSSSWCQPKDARLVQCTEINMVYKILKDRYHTVIFMDMEKVFNEVQHALVIKVLETFEISGTYLKMTTLNGEKLKTFPLKSEMEKRMPTISILSQYCTESLSQKNKTRKNI